MLVNPGWGVWDERYDEAFDRAAASLQSAADYAAQQGVRLVLEHLTPQSSNLLTSADKVSRMVRSIGRKNLGVALDLGQMSVFGESVSDYFGPLGDKIWMVHIMDGAPGRHLAFGDGILPLQAYCRQLRRAGYQGPITLEINDAQYAKAPEAALQQCLRAMAQWEEEAHEIRNPDRIDKRIFKEAPSAIPFRSWKPPGSAAFPSGAARRTAFLAIPVPLKQTSCASSCGSTGWNSSNLRRRSFPIRSIPQMTAPR